MQQLHSLFREVIPHTFKGFSNAFKVFSSADVRVFELDYSRWNSKYGIDFTLSKLDELAPLNSIFNYRLDSPRESNVRANIFERRR